MHSVPTRCGDTNPYLAGNYTPYIRESETNATVHRLLLFINTVQFLLCVAHFALHMVFSFLLFTVVTNVPTYLHHVNGFTLASNVIYNISVSLFAL